MKNFLQFNMLYADHATNGNTYIIDGFVQINDEDSIWTTSTLEDCSKPNIHRFVLNGYGKLDGVYYLHCMLFAEDEYQLTKEREDGTTYVIDSANYDVSTERFRSDKDDPLWEVLGYEEDSE